MKRYRLLYRLFLSPALFVFEHGHRSRMSERCNWHIVFSDCIITGYEGMRLQHADRYLPLRNGDCASAQVSSFQFAQ